MHPPLLKTIPAAPGAHHMTFSPEERIAYIENGILNYPGLSDGSITVINLDKLEEIDSIDTFPAETELPIVTHFNTKRTALQLALSGDADERTLKIVGQRLRDDIAALPGIRQV